MVRLKGICQPKGKPSWYDGMYMTQVEAEMHAKRIADTPVWYRHGEDDSKKMHAIGKHCIGKVIRGWTDERTKGLAIEFEVDEKDEHGRRVLKRTLKGKANSLSLGLAQIVMTDAARGTMTVPIKRIDEVSIVPVPAHDGCVIYENGAEQNASLLVDVLGDRLKSTVKTLNRVKAASSAAAAAAATDAVVAKPAPDIFSSPATVEGSSSSEAQRFSSPPSLSNILMPVVTTAAATEKSVESATTTSKEPMSTTPSSTPAPVAVGSGDSQNQQQQQEASNASFAEAARALQAKKAKLQSIEKATEGGDQAELLEQAKIIVAKKRAKLEKRTENLVSELGKWLPGACATAGVKMNPDFQNLLNGDAQRVTPNMRLATAEAITVAHNEGQRNIHEAEKRHQAAVEELTAKHEAALAEKARLQVELDDQRRFSEKQAELFAAVPGSASLYANGRQPTPGVLSALGYRSSASAAAAQPQKPLLIDFMGARNANTAAAAEPMSVSFATTIAGATRPSNNSNSGNGGDDDDRRQPAPKRQAQDAFSSPSSFDTRGYVSVGKGGAASAPSKVQMPSELISYHENPDMRNWLEASRSHAEGMEQMTTNAYGRLMQNQTLTPLNQIVTR